MARRRTTDEERAERRRQTTQIRRRVSTCFGKVYGTSKLPGSPLEVYLLIRRKEDGQYYYFNSNPRTNFPPTPQDLASITPKPIQFLPKPKQEQRVLPKRSKFRNRRRPLQLAAEAETTAAVVPKGELPFLRRPPRPPMWIPRAPAPPSFSLSGAAWDGALIKEEPEDW